MRATSSRDASHPENSRTAQISITNFELNILLFKFMYTRYATSPSDKHQMSPRIALQVVYQPIPPDTPTPGKL